MANVQMGGFRVWGTVTGGEGAFPATFVQEVANNYATALGIGDIIIPVSDGTVARAAASNDGLLLGVITGMSYVSTAAGGRIFSNYIPANTTFSPTTVGSANASLVQYVPLTADVILEVDLDAVLGTNTPAGAVSIIGNNVDLVVGTADTVTGVSGFAAATSTIATTTANFRIVGLRNYTLQGGFSALDNDPTVTRFKVLVVCNEAFWPSYTTSGI